MPTLIPSPHRFRLEAVAKALSLPTIEAARQIIAPYAPREEVEADLAEQVVYLKALIRDVMRRALAPDLPEERATRLHGSLRGFQRDLRAMLTALQRSQVAPVMLGDPDWDRSPYRRPIGVERTMRDDGTPLEPLCAAMSGRDAPALDSPNEAASMPAACGPTAIAPAVSIPAASGPVASGPAAREAGPGKPHPEQPGQQQPLQPAATRRDGMGRDGMGRDINGRDMDGRNINGRDMNGRGGIGNSLPQPALRDELRAATAAPASLEKPVHRENRATRRSSAWARKQESGDALARFASRRMAPERDRSTAAPARIAATATATAAAATAAATAAK